MREEFLKRLISSLVLISIIIFLIIKGTVFLNLFILFCLVISLYEWHIMKKDNIYYVAGIVFLFLSFYSVFRLTNLEADYSYFLLILIICISTDMGGYIFGKILKGKKLTKISPNKTYSGMLGSFALSLLFSYLFFKLTTFFSYINFNSINTIIFILLISLISQAGDIIISFFKRKSKIKNTGKIIPGHGGLLDRIDGMIFAFPFGYLFLSLEILK
tara:strand:+ start:654 stop:1301 length:648 start_codon:yes stop_codon:yes gene_type:complete